MKIKEVESSSEEEDEKTTSGGKTKKCHQKEGTLSGILYSWVTENRNTSTTRSFKIISRWRHLLFSISQFNSPNPKPNPNRKPNRNEF